MNALDALAALLGTNPAITAEVGDPPRIYGDVLLDREVTPAAFSPTPPRRILVSLVIRAAEDLDDSINGPAGVYAGEFTVWGHGPATDAGRASLDRVLDELVRLDDQDLEDGAHGAGLQLIGRTRTGPSIEYEDALSCMVRFAVSGIWREP